MSRSRAFVFHWSLVVGTPPQKKTTHTYTPYRQGSPDGKGTTSLPYKAVPGRDRGVSAQGKRQGSPKWQRTGSSAHTMRKTHTFLPTGYCAISYPAGWMTSLVLRQHWKQGLMGCPKPMLFITGACTAPRAGWEAVLVGGTLFSHVLLCPRVVFIEYPPSLLSPSSVYTNAQRKTHLSATL